MKNLLVLTPLPGFEPSDDEVRLTKKFFEGMNEYVKAWPGQVSVIMPRDASPTGNLDDVIVKKSSLDFSVELLDFSSQILRDRVRAADTVIGGPHYLHPDLARLCKKSSIPYIYVSEYTLRTRIQIVKAEFQNPIVAFKKIIWEILEEFKNINQVRFATAVQCNGMPTFNAYKAFNKATIIYFDNRISPEMLAKESMIQKKYDPSTFKGRSLQLAYSGRLNKMKGAHHLIPLAQKLRTQGVDFQLHIFGGGPLDAIMEAEIEEQDLANLVKLHGTVDFKSELVPFIKECVDIFICPHPQGDPSCTYVETFACGVPIAGFANEAFQGILSTTDSGWSVGIGDVSALAKLISQLRIAPEQVKHCALEALRFASAHTFELTFKNRMQQVLNLTK